MSDSVACSFCGGNSTGRRWTAREMYFGMGGSFDYVECGDCHSLNIDRVPDDLGSFYAPAGYGGHSQRLESRDAPRWRRMARALLTDLELARGATVPQAGSEDGPLRWLKRVGAKRSWRILDVGCGGGDFLRQLRALGFDQLHGIDKFAPDTRSEPGLTIQSGELGDVAGCFDLIMMHHSLEHMIEPAATLRDAVKLLSPKGWLLVRVPLCDGLAWQKYGVDWYQLDAPRHLHLPTVAGMQALARRSGLEIPHVDHDATSSQFIVSEGYRRGLTMIDQRNAGYDHVSAAAKNEFEVRTHSANLSGQGDQAAFFCRRR